MPYRRYGIYVTPEPGPLAEFGANWLGWDLATGQPCRHCDLPGLPAPVRDITATPRKYGLHGTIKPPFFLAPGTSLQSLETSLAALCKTLAPLTLDQLIPAQLGRFLALKIDGDQTPLAQLAATVVSELDSFRAPPSEAELQRRRKARLTPRQEALLAQWGYPYVMDQFRFHITLTGPLRPEAAAQTLTALTPVLTPLLQTPFTLTSLTLVGEDEAGMFHQIHRYALTG